MLRRILATRNFLQLTRASQFYKCEVIDLQSDQDFEKHIADNKKPVILDFYADWCGPCKLLTPQLIKKAESSDGWDLVKINIDKFEGLAEMLQITSVPTVILVHNQKSVDSFLGNNPAKLDSMVAKAEEIVKNSAPK